MIKKSSKLSVFLTEKMQLPVKNFHNHRGYISLDVNYSVPFGTRHFFGMPRRYPKFPKEILAAALRAKNAIAFFGLIIASSAFLLNLSFAQQQNQETITITTYYPAPFGVYQNLRLFPTTTIPSCAADNDEGTMYYDDTANINQLMVCRETTPGVYGWGVAGSNWTHPAGTDILYTNNNDWNVGIGTTTPETLLNVAGPFVSVPSPGLDSGGVIRLSNSGTDAYVQNRAIQMRIGANVDLESLYVPLVINNGSCHVSSGSFNAADCQNVYIIPNHPHFGHVNPARVGIGTNTPDAKLDVDGEVKVGNTGLQCNANTAGAIRYDSGTMSYCDGTATPPKWTAMGGTYGFGGAFAGGENNAGLGKTPDGGSFCEEPNPITGRCTCPAGYTANTFSLVKERNAGEYDVLYICWK